MTALRMKSRLASGTKYSNVSMVRVWPMSITTVLPSAGAPEDLVAVVTSPSNIAAASSVWLPGRSLLTRAGESENR